MFTWWAAAAAMGGQGFVKLKLYQRARSMEYLQDALKKAKALDVRLLSLYQPSHLSSFFCGLDVSLDTMREMRVVHVSVRDSCLYRQQMALFQSTRRGYILPHTPYTSVRRVRGPWRL